MKRIQELPTTLLAIFLVMLVVPVWSLSFVTAPWSASTMREAIIIGGLYWCAPLLLAVLILVRSFLFIPLFVLVEIGAAFHFFLIQQQIESTDQPVVLINLICLAAALALTVMLTSRDLRMPFTSVELRLWRRMPRQLVNTRLRLIDPNDQSRFVEIILEDFSLNGLAVAANSSEIESWSLCNGKELVVAGGAGHVTRQVKVRVVRVHGLDEHSRIALAIVDSPKVAKHFFDGMLGEREGSLIQTIERLWVTNAFRRGIIAIWGLSIIGSFGNPACGRHETSSRSPSETSQTTAGLGDGMFLTSEEDFEVVEEIVAPLTPDSCSADLTPSPDPDAGSSSCALCQTIDSPSGCCTITTPVSASFWTDQVTCVSVGGGFLENLDMTLCDSEPDPSSTPYIWPTPVVTNVPTYTPTAMPDICAGPIGSEGADTTTATPDTQILCSEWWSVPEPLSSQTLDPVPDEQQDTPPEDLAASTTFPTSSTSPAASTPTFESSGSQSPLPYQTEAPPYPQPTPTETSNGG